MSYIFHTDRRSPNFGGYKHDVSLPCHLVVVHWWGAPQRYNPWGIVNHLCSRISPRVSAHAVVWSGNVAKLLDYNQASWANGNADANASSITIECDPLNVDPTCDTLVEYLQDLVLQGVLAPDFELKGHKDFYRTACPGAYYPLLGAIRTRVNKALQNNGGKPKKKGERMVVISCPSRGIAIVGAGHYAPCRDGRDVEDAIRLADGVVLGTDDGEQWDRWRRLAVGEKAPALTDEDIERMKTAMANVSAKDVAEQLRIEAK